MLTCSLKDVGCNGVAWINAFCEDTRFMKEKNSYNYFWQCFLEVLRDQSGNYKINDTTNFSEILQGVFFWLDCFKT